MYEFAKPLSISGDILHRTDQYDCGYIAGGCGAQHTLEASTQRHTECYQLQRTAARGMAEECIVAFLLTSNLPGYQPHAVSSSFSPRSRRGSEGHPSTRDIRRLDGETSCENLTASPVHI